MVKEKKATAQVVGHGYDAGRMTAAPRLYSVCRVSFYFIGDKDAFLRFHLRVKPELYTKNGFISNKYQINLSVLYVCHISSLRF